MRHWTTLFCEGCIPRRAIHVEREAWEDWLRTVCGSCGKEFHAVLKDEGPPNPREPLAGVENGVQPAALSTLEDTPPEQTDTACLCGQYRGSWLHCPVHPLQGH